MKCLLVDDEPGIREGLAALLRRKGHDVRTAADCAAAAHALAADETFDVVVTDWHLPDGLAADFLAAARCPVIAVSGHPEEIPALAPITAVLTKPVTPTRLCEALAAARPEAPARAATTRSLPVDVRGVVDAALARLPADAAVELHDDGVFVRLIAELPDARPLALGLEDGDVRTSLVGGRRRLELRLCRDGRPDAGLPVVAPAAVWPSAGEFAVDFHGIDCQGTAPSALDPALGLATLLDRARTARTAGQRVHFLNVPAAVRAAAESQGRAHDMPMRAAVGPRLQPEHADLWSQP